MVNNPSVIQLQNQAAARVRQMEEHARRMVREHPVKIYRGTVLTPPIPQPTAVHNEDCLPLCEEPIGEPTLPVCQEEPPQKEPPCLPKKTNKGGVLSWLCGDTERTLLLLLAVVLWQNGAPPELLLALLYVAL